MFLTGAAKSLFTPLAMAVVFAMLPSYLLSRTLVPTMIRFMLPSEVKLYQSKGAHEKALKAKPISLLAPPVRHRAAT